MSALKSPQNPPLDASQHPYPSWDVVATSVGARQGLDSADLQARKEAQIWRELAEEPQNDDRTATDTRQG